MDEPVGYSLTPAQQNVLNVVDEAIAATGVSPSFDEIAAAVGTCKSNVARLISCLEQRGAIRRVPGHRRTLTICSPLTVDANFQLAAEELLARWYEAGILTEYPTHKMLKEIINLKPDRS